MLETINLTPNPRILQMLGQIDFENWQCIAELIDNSVDALLKDFTIYGEYEGKIMVDIPKHTQFIDGVPISVWDNGPGMDVGQLENALKAGFSSNDPVSNLGLFGMGFNIATARLGQRTTVFSSKKGTSEEVGIEIDFAEMTQQNSYIRPVKTRAKDNSYTSGTTIRIYNLKDRVSHLGQQGLASLRKKLSTVYSKLLRDHKIEIIINGEKLIPNKKCIWRPERHVIRKGEKIHAYIEINEDLGSQYYCSKCWIWLDAPYIEGETCICSVCGFSEDVIKRDRKVTGWLGIQRYYHKDNFGIDFYRNGRLIIANDKSLFNWKNPETGEDELEYPIDAVHLGGRIVGEIEANFLSVTYTKDSIEKNGQHWDLIVKSLRGEAPIRPNIAVAKGYSENNTPIARLFSGYRKGNKPGYEDLFPGKLDKNGNLVGNNAEPKAWAELFYKGDPEYQDDTKWWQLVEQVEAGRRSSGEGNPDDNNIDPTDPFNIGNYDNNGNGESNNNEGGSEDNPFQSGQGEQGQEDSGDSENNDEPTLIKEESLSGQYSLDELNEEPIILDVFSDPSLQDDKPLVVEKLSRSNYRAFYNENSPLFMKHGNSIKDCILMELANSLFLRKNDPDEWPFSRIFYNLKNVYSKEDALDLDTVKERINKLLAEIKKTLSEPKREIQPEISLDKKDMKSLQRAVLNKLGEGDIRVQQLIKTTEFLAFMPNSYIIKFFKNKPELFFDGIVWKRPYDEIGDTEIKEELVDEFYSYLTDILWILENEEEKGNITRFKRNVGSLIVLEEYTFNG
ncbi:ATP-binding protein [Fictibacillus enclensis]|uniref:ATP-binding protein n=1 Tax=Fictibacillus enclensis TaxID=1017270 RepID=UPI0025A02E17|nr:ATP-binding protein [Fictibacillus enclensis]MDM5197039.1 ATP-binding protein [Fictibacillus enclensis]